MKKLLTLLIFTVVLLALPNFKVYGQGGNDSLSVIEMFDFPDLPLDSAYEGINYSFYVTVINQTNVTINSTLEIVMRVDSVESTILANPVTSLPPGDTLVLFQSQYFFTQPQFKAGNNIVVVWPRVPGLSLPADTFYTNVYFIPLNSTGMPFESDQGSLQAFPNPATHQIQLFSGDEPDLEYVRIFDTTGRLVHQSGPPINQMLDISFLRSGTYFLEAVSGKRAYRTKFIRY